MANNPYAKVIDPVRKYVPIGTGGGGSGGFTDDFSLKLIFPDSNDIPTDAMALAMIFPESNAEPLDALTIKFQLDDSNAVPTDVDTYAIALALADSNATQADVDAYLLALAQADSNASLTETVQLAFPAGDYDDSTAAPFESNSFTMRVWLSASAQTAGTVTNPSNADGQNNGTVASMTTAALGTNPVMTSTLGANVPSGVNVASAIYRGWWQAAMTLPTSHCIITLHSTSALFADVNIVDVTASVNHLTGDFTYDLIANGINTLAKIQSIQVLHKSTDAVAGVTPATFTVDAGCIELAAAFTTASNQISIANVQVFENDGTAVITVLRSAPDGTTTTLDYATADGTTAPPALSTDDYTTTSGSLSFTGVQTSQQITVPLIDNNYTEPDRVFKVNLSNISNGTLTNSQALVTVQDNEAGKTFLQDYSGNGRDLTAGSTATTNRACPQIKFDKGRDFGNAVNSTVLFRQVTGETAIYLDLSITIVFDLDALPNAFQRRRLVYTVQNGQTAAASGFNPYEINITNSGTSTTINYCHGGLTAEIVMASPPSIVATGYHTFTLTRNSVTRTVVGKLDGSVVINGTYAAGADEPQPQGDAVRFAVGGRADGFDANQALDGAIYDLRIWNSLISQAVLDSIVASSGKCKPEGTEYAFYRLEDT